MIAAKTKVALLTNQRISRFELLGALILSRLMKTVKSALQQLTTMKSEVYLPDSQEDLTCIKTADKNASSFLKTG